MVGGIADRIKRRIRIQQLLELGYSVGAICDEEQCSRMTVLRWKKRFEAGEGEQDRPRGGRPRKLPEKKASHQPSGGKMPCVDSQDRQVASQQRGLGFTHDSPSHFEGGRLQTFPSTQAALDSTTKAQTSSVCETVSRLRLETHSHD